MHYDETPETFTNQVKHFAGESKGGMSGGTIASMLNLVETARRDRKVARTMADPYALVTIDPDRDPFDANQAIPTLLFGDAAARTRLEKTIPSLRVLSVDWQSLFAYPMSGGFQPWSLIPGAAVPPVLALERRFPDIIRKHLAFRMMIVLERR